MYKVVLKAGYYRLSTVVAESKEAIKIAEALNKLESDDGKDEVTVCIELEKENF